MQSAAQSATGKCPNQNCRKMKNDWSGRGMPSQLQEILIQAVEHEPSGYDPLQQSPWLLHANHGKSQQQTFSSYHKKQLKNKSWIVKRHANTPKFCHKGDY